MRTATVIRNSCKQTRYLWRKVCGLEQAADSSTRCSLCVAQAFFIFFMWLKSCLTQQTGGSTISLNMMVICETYTCIHTVYTQPYPFALGSLRDVHFLIRTHWSHVGDIGSKQESKSKCYRTVLTCLLLIWMAKEDGY